MRVHQNFLLVPTMLLVALWEYQVAATKRKQQTDSILEIMNTREIEQLLAERRLNSSREDGNQFVLQNDLDEDFTESSRIDRYRQQRRQQQSREVGFDFGYNQRQNSGEQRFPGDVLMKYNDSLLSDKAYTSESAIDMQGIRGDKLLKSSKNALYITKKEYLKKDWCKTEPLVQRIREQGCLTRTFINRFCYGQCNSFYIPKSPKRRRNAAATTTNSRYIQPDQLEDEDLTPPAFRSCGFCKPKKFTWITITLRCPTLVPQLRKKRVQRIKQCKCMAEPLD